MSVWTLRRCLRPFCWAFGHGKPLSTEYILARIESIAAPCRDSIPVDKLVLAITNEKRRRSRWEWCSRCGLKLKKVTP